MTESFHQTPPKSADSIRSKLNSMHAPTKVNADSKPDQPAGPLIGGFAADHPITVASFYERDMAKAFQTHLSKEGIFSKLFPYKQGAKVVVDAEDSQAAARIFANTKDQFPNVRTIRFARRFDYLIFGVLLGLAMATIFLVYEMNHPLTPTVGISFCVIGALIGHLIDRIRIRSHRTGRFGVGVWEFLIIATLPAPIYFLSQAIPNILF